MHSVRQIEVVRALAKRRHFGLAAKQLGVSEPALSRSLKQLESELGVRLFDRQGVVPTLFGEIVLKHGERAVTEFDELLRELALAKGLEIGGCVSPPPHIRPIYRVSVRSGSSRTATQTCSSNSGSPTGRAWWKTCARAGSTSASLM
jgi:DNA-binding transcriptional LysR family regulator